MEKTLILGLCERVNHIQISQSYKPVISHNFIVDKMQ